MPVVVGRSPSMRLVREGLHNGAWQCALRKVVPREASLSRCGVLAMGWPPRWPIQSFWSSMAMKRMLGLSAAGSVWQRQRDNEAKRKSLMIGMRRKRTDTPLHAATFEILMPHSTSRRNVLKQLGSATLALTNGTRAFAQSVPGLVGSDAWKKHGELFRHTGEPAGGWVQNFTSTVEPLDGGRWRVWGSVTVPKTKGDVKQIGHWTQSPDGKWGWSKAVCTPGEPDSEEWLAIGGMPAGWNPVQVVMLRLKDGRTRLYFWAHGKGVVRYIAADSDDGRAFRVVNALTPCLYHPVDRAVDGKVALELGLEHFSKRRAATVEGEKLAPAGLISNDATNVYQLPDGSFEMYSVGLIQVGKDDPRYAAQDNIPGLVRVIDRLTSADGLNWDNRQRVITPDAKDPHDLQFYYLSVTHTERGRVGLLGHYRLDAQTIDIEPCFSTDGIIWQREQREPWVPRDAAGVTAGSYLLHAPHALVQHDGLWHLFYTGGNFSHNHKESHGPEARAIMLATTETLWA